MAKRTSKKAAKNPDNQHGISWVEAVSKLRHKTDAEPYRLGVLKSLIGWTEFTAAWHITAPGMIRLDIPDIRFDGKKDIELLHFWTWAALEDTGVFDAIIEVINETVGLPTIDIISCYWAMRNAALIHPDGSVNSRVMNRADSVIKSEESRDHNRSIARSIKSIQLEGQLSRLIEKHENRLDP